MGKKLFDILYLSHTGSTIGGGEIQLIGLVKNLDRNLYNPIIICPDSGVFSDKLKNLGIPVHISLMPGWRKARSFFSRQSACRRLINLAKQYDVSIVHTSDLWLNYYAWHLGKELKIPTISHVRNYLKAQDIHKYLFDRFDMIIALSEFIKEPLIHGGIASEKIRIISDGVDTSEFRPVDENVLRRDYPLRKHLIGLVGRIEPFKRQKDFIQVVSEVLKDRQDVSFLIIGDSMERQSSYLREVQQAIEKYDVTDYIVFTGHRYDMPQILQSLDIIVTLSGGSIMLEAMACGKPVVSASKANPADLKIVRDGEAGFVVPYDDIPSVSKAVLNLLENKEIRGKMGKAGRKRVENMFSMQKITTLTESVYKELLRIRN